jgi:hypothetical protein
MPGEVGDGDGVMQVGHGPLCDAGEPFTGRDGEHGDTISPVAMPRQTEMPIKSFARTA